MRKNIHSLFFIEIILLSSLIINSFFINFLTPISLAVTMGIFLILIIYRWGFEIDNRRFNKDALLTITICGASYYFCIYAAGIFIGLYKNSNDLSYCGMFKNIVTTLAVILITELFRYSVVIKVQKNKCMLIMLVLILIFCDVTFMLSAKHEFMNISQNIKILSLYILPSIINNIFLTYISLKIGYKPTILYRCIFEIPVYFLPLFPAMGSYIKSVLGIFLPILLLMKFRPIFLRKSRSVLITELRKNQTPRITINILIAIPIITLIFLISGLFKYYALAVGSGSMTPQIYKGDMVIVKKLDANESKNLKTGDILVYKYFGRVIVHRITEISRVNDTYYFYTKGDNNVSADRYVVKQENVIGYALLRIPFIGYPTVWLNKQLNF